MSAAASSCRPGSLGEGVRVMAAPFVRHGARIVAGAETFDYVARV